MDPSLTEWSRFVCISWKSVPSLLALPLIVFGILSSRDCAVDLDCLCCNIQIELVVFRINGGDQSSANRTPNGPGSTLGLVVFVVKLL